MRLLLAVATLFVCINGAHAYFPKGMKVYKKMCVECHGSPFRGAKMKNAHEWEELQKSSAEPLVALHKNDTNAVAALRDGYLTPKRQEYLFMFLIGNAKDSGSVPGCDGNYCGSSK